jgi:hypothetical protein
MLARHCGAGQQQAHIKKFINPLFACTLHANNAKGHTPHRPNDQWLGCLSWLQGCKAVAWQTSGRHAPGGFQACARPLPPASSHWFVQPWCTKATTAYSAQNVRLAPGARSDIHVMTARHRHHTGGSMAIALPPNCRQRLRLNLRTAITTTQLNRFVAPTAYWGLPSKAALTVTAIYSPPQNGPFGNSKQAETAYRTAHTATPNSTKAQPSGCQ